VRAFCEFRRCSVRGEQWRTSALCRVVTVVIWPNGPAQAQSTSLSKNLGKGALRRPQGIGLSSGPTDHGRPGTSPGCPQGSGDRVRALPISGFLRIPQPVTCSWRKFRLISMYRANLPHRSSRGFPSAGVNGEVQPEQPRSATGWEPGTAWRAVRVCRKCRFCFTAR
jgi:hypothetical protein